MQSGTVWLFKVSFNIINSFALRKNICTCLFSVHNTVSLSRHEQVCLIKLRFERYFSHHQMEKYLSNLASLNILVHVVINLLYHSF